MTRFAAFSVVVLTHDRPEEFLRLARELREFSAKGAEILIVDNASPRPVSELLAHDEFTILRLPTNEGAVGRNHGIRRATRDIVITLDDDLFGLAEQAFETLEQRFAQASDTAAICFRVLSAKPPHTQINWCHHYRIEEFSHKRFVTDEISEGAVAFRKSALQHTALYPEEFFISHEGVALAYQLMNAGYKVEYDPDVAIYHETAQRGRSSDRRYYYDTRNTLWVAVRYMPVGRALFRLIGGIGSMLVYSIRDRHVLAWLRGLFDGLRGLRRQYEKRRSPGDTTRQILSSIDPYRPSILYMLKKRLFQSTVEI
jgi:GT2 family glycosyltransferase